MITISLMTERITSIDDISRDFRVSEVVTPIVKPKGFVAWCKLPYPKHPEGCPNFGVKKTCPPKIEYFLDVYKPVIKIVDMTFDFEQYLNWRRGNHPDWTEKALRNPRHFQNHLDANLERFADNLNVPGFVPEYDPEAMGINVHLTCKKAGIELEWPPTKIMHRIAVLAQPIK